MQTNGNRIFYHYCSIDPFLKIMKSSELWLSDIRKSNDSLEFKWVLRKCKGLIDLIILEISEDIRKLKSEKKATQKQLILQHNLNEIMRDINDVYTVREEDNMITAWVLCFSQKADSLDQWRGYANDGNGVAIGFKQAFLESLNQIVIPPHIELSCRFSPIDYGIDDEKYKKLLHIDTIDENSDPNIVRFTFLKALSRALALPPIYKNPSFKEEEEWRIYFHSQKSKNLWYNESAIINCPDTFNGHLEIRKRGFYTRANRIVSYIPLYIPNMINAIEEIVIGPKADIDEIDIKKVLIQYNHYDQKYPCPVKIIKSSSSYHSF